MIRGGLTSVGLVTRPGSRRSWLAESNLNITISGDPTIYRLTSIAKALGPASIGGGTYGGGTAFTPGMDETE